MLKIWIYRFPRTLYHLNNTINFRPKRNKVAQIGSKRVNLDLIQPKNKLNLVIYQAFSSSSGEWNQRGTSTKTKVECPPPAYDLEKIIMSIAKRSTTPWSKAIGKWHFNIVVQSCWRDPHSEAYPGCLTPGGHSDLVFLAP